MSRHVLILGSGVLLVSRTTDTSANGRRDDGRYLTNRFVMTEVGVRRSELGCSGKRDPLCGQDGRLSRFAG
jgi:hypothetical protein